MIHLKIPFEDNQKRNEAAMLFLKDNFIVKIHDIAFHTFNKYRAEYTIEVWKLEAEEIERDDNLDVAIKKKEE